MSKNAAKASNPPPPTYVHDAANMKPLKNNQDVEHI